MVSETDWTTTRRPLNHTRESKNSPALLLISRPATVALAKPSTQFQMPPPLSLSSIRRHCYYLPSAATVTIFHPPPLLLSSIRRHCYYLPCILMAESLNDTASITGFEIEHQSSRTLCGSFDRICSSDHGYTRAVLSAIGASRRSHVRKSNTKTHRSGRRSRTQLLTTPLVASA